MTFAELKTEVNLLVIDTPTAVQQLVGRFINRAIRKLQNKHDFQVNKAIIAYTTMAATRTLGNLPDDWKKLRAQPVLIHNDGHTSPMYMALTPQALQSYGFSTQFDVGQPELLTETGNVLSVWPYSDSLSDYSDGEYRINVYYWASQPDLVADGDTNWFTENAEQWIIYQAVADAFYANEDEGRAQLWEQRAAREYLDVIKIDKMRVLANLDTLAYHTGALPPHTQE